MAAAWVINGFRSGDGPGCPGGIYLRVSVRGRRSTNRDGRCSADGTWGRILAAVLADADAPANGAVLTSMHLPPSRHSGSDRKCYVTEQ